MRAGRQACVLHSLMLSNAVNAAMHDFNIEPDMLLYMLLPASPTEIGNQRPPKDTSRRALICIHILFLWRLSCAFRLFYVFINTQGRGGRRGADASAMIHDEYIHTRLAAVLFMAIKFHFTTTAATAKKRRYKQKMQFSSNKIQFSVCVCGVAAYNYVCFV